MNDWTLSRMRERNQKPGRPAPWPVFTSEAERDRYLDRLIGNCYQVKALDLPGPDGPRYTVEDIDQRKGG